jgi:hypothetical protein
MSLLLLALFVAAPVDWNDGHAELAGYELLQPRYKEMRPGSAVLIFVKEDFSSSHRVKADPGKHPPSDVFPVLKLNVMKSFQTGIYRYNLMTSAFTATQPALGRNAGAAAKVVFSNQEWCGAMFEELLFDPQSIRMERFSYFDGEADEKSILPYPENGLSVDTLPIVVRQIQGRLLQAGESRELSLLPSLERTRLTHRKLEWVKAKVSRSAKPQKVTVPAGSFLAEVWTFDLGAEKYIYRVEAAEPRRLLEWEGPDGEKGRLLAAKRLKYWELNREGDEKYLRELGIDPKTFMGR